MSKTDLVILDAAVRHVRNFGPWEITTRTFWLTFEYATYFLPAQRTIDAIRMQYRAMFAHHHYDDEGGGCDGTDSQA